jgi:hypothetical protein
MGLPLTPNGKLTESASPSPRGTWPLTGRKKTDLEREVADWRSFSSPIGPIQTLILAEIASLVSLFDYRGIFGRHLTVDVLTGGLTIAGGAVTQDAQSRRNGLIPSWRSTTGSSCRSLCP